MRIAVVGAGAIGSILGASLAQSGQDVTFIVRGNHLTAIRANGLRVEGDRGETLVRPATVTDDPATVGPVDLVLFCVKLWDVETAGAQLRPLMAAETGVVPLQNGVDASERLVPLIGSEHVLGGIAVVTGSIVAPGVARQSGKHHGITFGEMDGRITPRAERIRDVCQAAGIQANISDNIQRDRWDKFVGLVAASGICALARQSIGGLRDDPDIAPLFEASMQEVVKVGRASGVALGPEVVERWIQFMGNVPPNWTPSMAVALLAGARLELPWLAGKVVELGRVRNVPTPVNPVIYGTLKPFTDGAQHSPRAA